MTLNFLDGAAEAEGSTDGFSEELLGPLEGIPEGTPE